MLFHVGIFLFIHDEMVVKHATLSGGPQLVLRGFENAFINDPF